MNLPALRRALVAALMCVPPAAVAQSPPPFYVSGPAPDPLATACPGEPATLPSVVTPSRVAISPASTANFKAHDTGDRVLLMIGMRQDGQGEAHIPPTNDIDLELRQALATFARGVTIKSPLPGCARWAALVIVSIDATDGTVRTVQTLQPPVKPFPPGIPLAAPGTSSATVLVGPTPDPSGTACPGEHDGGGRTLGGPRTIALPADSPAFVRAHNNGRDFVIVIVAIRLDGQASIAFPSAEAFDPALRETLLAYSRKLTITRPIADCAHPAALLYLRVSMTDGSVIASPANGPPKS